MGTRGSEVRGEWEDVGPKVETFSYTMRKFWESNKAQHGDYG